MQTISHIQEFVDPISLEDDDSDNDSDSNNDSENENSDINQNNLQSNQRTTILNPISDICTRWNSTFLVIQRLYQLRDPIFLMIENLKKDPNKNYQADGKCLEELFLNNNEWLAINELIELLNPFALATTIIGGSFYPTLSITYPIIIQLIDNTKKNITKINNPKIKEVATELYNNIKDRWQELDITAHIASFLDPCFKNLEFLKAYQKREVHNNVQELIQEEELVNDSNFEQHKKNLLYLYFLVKPISQKNIQI
jgi:hypothetical protein